MFAQVELVVSARGPMVSVPLSTVIDSDTRQIVLVQQSEGRFAPRQVKLQRARSLLEKLLAAEDADSRALQPYARALLQQIDERQRLGALNARLSQQLTRSDDALRDSKERNEKLQQQLDALTEIERSLATRAPVPVLPR